MNYTLNDLLDTTELQALLDSLDEINNLPSAVIDVEGNILTATAWQEICTQFHRKNEHTASKCIDNDTRINARVHEIESPMIYRCPMGLVDSATPIVVEGKHLGNVLMGQILFEQPDEAYFSEQARRYGFEENSYLKALRKVPLCSMERLRVSSVFAADLVQMLAEQGLQKKRLIESERELRENEKKLKVIFDTSEAGIIVVSPEGIITFSNRRMAEMFGVSVPELIGTPYTDYLHESEKQAAIESMSRIVEGKVKSIELIRHYQRKDGTDFWGNLTGTRFENVDGSMRDQIIVVSDITERKRAEEEKKLLEQQLQQAQKLESLGVLAGGIAHDFNNIMTIIMGNCYLMRINQENHIDNISVIEKAAERAAELCRQMLAYAGKAPTEHYPVSLEVLTNDIVKLLKTTLPKNIVISFDVADQIPLVTADSSQLSQIVMNLVINASEAIGEMQGEIRIALSTEEIAEEQSEKDYFGSFIPSGRYVCLEVKDNGSGMDSETRNRIFEPFYTTKFHGRGLGMSAILGILKGHDGLLQLDSQVNQGTVFKVFLPVKARESLEKQQPSSIAEKPLQGSGTILLVEDEEQTLFALKTMLEKTGFKVIGAVNGKEALDQYQLNVNEIDLVITDIGMPVMDGYQLFQELKKMNEYLPVIITTGFGNTEVATKISLKEIAGLINKPYNFDYFRKTVLDVMDDVKKLDTPPGDK